jgi:uncharacterized protein (DUF2235 family)
MVRDAPPCGAPLSALNQANREFINLWLNPDPSSPYADETSDSGQGRGVPKNIVICCDGTGNEIGSNISNVLKLYQVLDKTGDQRVYYTPGVGTIGLQSAWQRWKQLVQGVFGLATGYGLDDDVLGAYRFLCETYQAGDKVWLFGFSRGAYAVRMLAAFVHVIGIVTPDELNLAGYALTAYKKSSADSQRADAKNSVAPSDETKYSRALEAAWEFSRIARGNEIRIEFVGVWDTVASVIVPRDDILGLDFQTLRYTRTNSSVKTFRQAMSIDERRRMFRLNRWTDPQQYRPDPFVAASEIPQDIHQVWFAGVHGDVGGGYPETESGLSKFPLLWMIQQAQAKGLAIDQTRVEQLVLGKPDPHSKQHYVAANATAQLHDSMTAAWEILEWLPKSTKWQEWPDRPSFMGWYLPRSEPRVIPQGAFVHQSVVERMEKVPSYRPVNLPATYQVEELVAEAETAPAVVPPA